MARKMTLADEIEKIVRGANYVSDFGVWANEPFTAESEARQGQGQFENGGLLDEKSFFATNEQIIDAAHSWCDGDPNAEDCQFGMDEIVSEVIDFIKMKGK